MSTQTVWYAERAAGIVSYGLLTALVLLGLMLSNRVRTRRWPMFAVEDVHRFVGILTGVFVALHVSLLLVDSFMPFSLPQVLVPFTAGYRPLATGLGTVALELLVAVAIANTLRRRVPYRIWRATHYLGFAVWAAATAHGLTAGSDRHDTWLLALYLVAIASVLAGLVVRLAGPRPVGEALGMGAVGAVAVVAFLAILPTAGAPSRAAASRGRSLPPTYTGTLTARIEREEGTGASLLSIDGRTTGSKAALVRIDLLGNAFRIERTSLQVQFPNAETCVGTISRLSPAGFAGDCRTANGQSRAVKASWTVRGGGVRGRLSVT